MLNRIPKLPSAVVLTALSLLLSPAAGSAAAPSMDPENAVGKSLGAHADANCARNFVCNSAPAVSNGEAWVSGGLIWRTNFINGFLELVDTNNGCQVVRECPAPLASAPSELTYQNGILYEYDFGTGLITAINPENCQILGSCDAPGDDLAEGLTSDGTYLYKGDSTTIIKFTFASATAPCQIVARCPNPAGDSADGLTFCNGQLVMLGYSGTMYRIDFDNCAITGTCQLNLGPQGNGITSDETTRLWADNSNGDLDLVDVGCSIPTPVQTSTWSRVKSRFTD